MTKFPYILLYQNKALTINVEQKNTGKVDPIHEVYSYCKMSFVKGMGIIRVIGYGYILLTFDILKGFSIFI